MYNLGYSKILNIENLPKVYFDKEEYKKNHENDLLILLIILILIIIIFFPLYMHFFSSKEEEKKEKQNPLLKNYENVNSKVNKKFDFNNKIFGLITRKDCPVCGLFSYYSVHLGCILTYLNEGYIPIIDVGSFDNIFNSFHKGSSKKNPWELFFNQPFGYTLDEVKKNAKNIQHLYCSWTKYAPSENEIYSDQLNIDFYREMSRKYMPVRKEIINEANIIWKKLFKKSKNVLGVLGRGTDFLYYNPPGHSIPPSAKRMIKDVKKMNRKNKYDWIYLATEDNIIKHKFIKEFGKKIKMVQNTNIIYQGGYVGEYKIFQGIKFQKIYLLSMITLSKCIDVIIARCSGAMGAFIFSKGFRESIVYYLGQYS